MMRLSNRVAFVIGVSGCGKSTIGQHLADQWGATFADADDYHPAANRQKMEAGIPLNDDDRRPWLATLNTVVAEQLPASNLVVACSALKQIYRDQLSESIESQCKWVLLDGSFELIQARMASRDHFMPIELLQSQFDILEKPKDGIHVDIEQPIEAIILQLIDWLSIDPPGA